MSQRRRLILVVVLGLAVHAPALLWGFFADDHGHQLVLGGEVPDGPMRPWSLYDFGAAPAPGDAHFESGSFAWWTDTDWKVRFLRPLTSLSLMADHAVFGGWAPGYHVTGLLLFALLLLAAHALYRAVGLGAGAALLGTLLLAVEDGGVFPVGWIANRNTLIEALLLTLALVVALRPARLRWPAVAGALLLAAGAALAKESGGVALPLVAFALVLRARGAGPFAGRAPDGGERRVALSGAAVALVLAALYLALYLGAGYGARSAFYPTPWGEPGAVARTAVLLLGTAPLTMTSPFLPDPLQFHPAVADAVLPVAAVLGLAFLAGLAALARRVPRALPLVAITLLALLPQAGAPLSDRLLFVPMVGFAGILGLVVERWRARGGARRLAARAVLVSAVGLSALSALARGAQFVWIRDSVVDAIVHAEVGGPEEAGPEGFREALVLNSPTEFAMLVPLTTWVVETGDHGVRFWPLQMGRRPATWTRLDETSFELRFPPDAGLPIGHGAIERVFLARPVDDARALAGRRWRTALFEVEAGEPDDLAGGLRAVTFHLPASLDDPRFAFLAWSDGRFRRVAPPAVGASVRIEAPEPLVPLMP